MYEDTIAAIATPIGQGAIGIVRLSGPRSLDIASAVFDSRLCHRRAVYGRLRDPDTGRMVDEAQVVYCRAPHSYTREDTVEISCHGGAVAVQTVLSLLLRRGARLANPGEFTLRAFLNGRIDLAQAEAVLDIIQARTEAGMRAANAGLAGRLSKSLREVRSELMKALAYLTACIDFPEDDVEQQDLLQPVRRARDLLAELIAGADRGIVYRQGVRTVLAGRPNVGKSSLLNALLRESRAIVTPVAGTTRDTLEETLNLQGVPFLLTDTAGIVESDSLVERMGVERSRQALDRADLVLLVLDGSEPIEAGDAQIMALLKGKMVISVASKADLPQRLELGRVPWPCTSVSAITGQGLGELEQRLVQTALGGMVVTSDLPLVTNPRHKEALLRAQIHVLTVERGLAASAEPELIAIDLSAAVSALGEITGETVTDELLESIFSRYCIGK